jgi:hypothetical protein
MLEVWRVGFWILIVRKMVKTRFPRVIVTFFGMPRILAVNLRGSRVLNPGATKEGVYRSDQVAVEIEGGSVAG